MLAGLLVLGIAAETQARTVPADAVEQDEDTYLHTGPAYGGAQGASTVLKIGRDFDSGDGMALLRWDPAGFPDPLRKVIADFEHINSGDGSFAVHQMLVDWDESTVKADFGGGLPIAGMHYRREPVAAFGFNDETTYGYGSDQFDLTRLFLHWQANPPHNYGLIAVPRGRLNANYPGVFGNETQLAARERAAGVDGNDLWVVPTAGASSALPNVLEAIEDATLYEDSPDYLRSGKSIYTSLDDRTGQRDYSLLKFGFGDLLLDGTDLAGRGFAQADLELHTVTSDETVAFNVHRMLTPWDEVTVTWNQFGAGGPVAGTDYAAVPIGSGTLGGGAYSVTIDILSAANEWAADPSSNHGLVLIPTTADTMTDNLSVVASERVLGGLDVDDTRLAVTVAPPRGTVLLVKSRDGVSVTINVTGAGTTSVGIYDDDGVLRRRLALGVLLGPGMQQLMWDGRDDQGEPVEAGQYEVRAVTADLDAVWRQTVGNSGDPPWEPSAIRGACWHTAARVGNDLVGGGPTGEGNRHFQRWDDQGQVVWSSAYERGHGDETAMTADEKYVYIVSAIDSETDPETGEQLLYDVIWRLHVATGLFALWPGAETFVEVTPQRRYPGRVADSADDYLERYEICDLASANGRLYVPCRRLNVIRVYDRESGVELAPFTNVDAPRGIAVAPDGSIYAVSETQVLRFDSAGQPLGAVVQGLSSPWDVELDTQGNLVVSDLGTNHHVNVYTPAGQLIRTFGLQRDARAMDGRLDRMFYPMGLAVDAAGRVIVAELGHGRLLAWKQDGAMERVVEAHGMGGNNGGATFRPDDPQWLFTSNRHMRFGGTMTSLSLYRTGLRRPGWEVVRRWPAVAPVQSTEPLRVQRLGGRTYVYLLGRFLTVYEATDDGRLEFCAAILSKMKRRLTAHPEIFDQASDLGLLDENDYCRARMVWTDANRNRAIEAGEVEVHEGRDADRELYSYNDGHVDAEGNIIVGDLRTRDVWRLDCQGFDAAGNPRYSWSAAQRIWTGAEHPESTADGCYNSGKQVDADGNLYLTQFVGPPCTPQTVRLVKYSPAGKRLWSVGRKARGLKDQPGEFIACTAFAGIVDGVVYALEYEGRVDAFTDDGLYLATFLRSGKKGSKGPYTNWGENFHGDVVKDPKTGKVIFTINTHNYCLPWFEVTGLESIQRSRSSVTLRAGDMLEADTGSTQRAAPPVDPHAPKTAEIVRRDSPVHIDGELDDWEGIAGERVAVPEAEDTHAVISRAGFDRENLYTAFHISDPGPAVNKTVAPAALWHGDCVELRISNDITWRATPNNPWSPMDRTLLLAASPGQPRVGLVNQATGKLMDSSGVRRVCRVWTGGNGYDLECAIPWNTLGWTPPRLGDRLRYDWNVNYANDATGEFGFKLLWTTESRGAHYQTRGAWDWARLINESGGLETSAYARAAEMPCLVDGRDDEWAGVPTVGVAVAGTDNGYRASVAVLDDPRQLCFLWKVRDPDPAINTASISQWWATGDFIEVYLTVRNREHRVLLPATRDERARPYFLRDAQPVPVEQASTRIALAADKAGYVMEVALPWAALGGRPDSTGAVTLPFGWLVHWSDPSGGSALVKQNWPAGAYGADGKLYLESE